MSQRHSGTGVERRHDGRLAIEQPNPLWCSDGFEISCDNGGQVRAALTLDCCNCEEITWVAATGGIGGREVRDLMTESVERRFGTVGKLPAPIEWLSDNSPSYTARETRAFAQLLGFVACTTPIDSAQSNGMAEAFVQILKRGYARIHPRPNPTVGALRPQRHSATSTDTIGASQAAPRRVETRSTWLDASTAAHHPKHHSSLSAYSRTATAARRHGIH